MKTIRISSLATIIFFAIMFVISCKKEDKEETVTTNIVPSNFYVDVPDAISANVSATYKQTNDTLKGPEIYGNLRAYIKVGENSAKLVHDIIQVIRQNNLDRPMEFNFVSKDDKRTKNVKITEGVVAENFTWRYKMEIKDQDGSKAMQVYWKNSPIKGIAILNFYNIDRRDVNLINKDVMYRVNYEETTDNYQKQMLVTITNLPKQDNGSIRNFKMFVGKNNETVELYGNSEHPYLKIIDTNTVGGYNYAFAGRANELSNVAVAKVALPSCSLNNTQNMFTDYSVFIVLRNAILKHYNSNDTAYVENVLKNAKTPGYFIGSQGFVSCGTNIPSNASFTSNFININSLEAYKPSEIATLSISFL